MPTIATDSAILNELRHLPSRKRQEVLDFIQFLRSKTPSTKPQTSHKKQQDIQSHQEWLEKNRDALDAYNTRIEQRGVFSDGLRLF